MGNDCADENFQVRQTDGLVLRRAASLADNHDLATPSAAVFLLRKTKNKIKSVLHNFADRVEVRALFMKITTSCCKIR